MSRTSIQDIQAKYDDGVPLTMLTAYDAPIARRVDDGGVDMILVGDSAGHNHHGYEDTIPLTLEEALSNTAAVDRAADEAMVVADMPFLSYGTSMAESVENAGRFMKEAGADAVKLETAPYGETTIDIVDRLTELGMPVLGHVGLTPQRMNQIGGAFVQGRDHDASAAADALVDTADQLVEAGAFAVVLEAVSEEAARRVTEAIPVPTIGIGAGRHVDGQVLVITDMLGLSEHSPSLAREYVDLDDAISSAVEQFVTEVETGEFPTREHTYDPIDEE
ncbi:3-methyl-2-oxobutanoate hydroxymethyltransferase [Halobacteriales archaeon QS_4_66_20]|nr:MAG: 3-methyl-2-oxobutanoate hydroxymethyltransferase [Halobacteriales archaeon QS_4_66_20]